MPHGIIGIGLLIVMSFVIFNDLLMLAAPNKHRRFLTWFQGMDSGPAASRAQSSWARPRPSPCGHGSCEHGDLYRVERNPRRKTQRTRGFSHARSR